MSIVRSGRVVDTGSLDDLRHLTRTRVHAVLRRPPTAAEASAWAGVHEVVLDGDALSCAVDAEHLGDLVAALGRRGVTGLTCRPPTLEELFLARYQSVGPARAVAEQPA